MEKSKAQTHCIFHLKISKMAATAIRFYFVKHQIYEKCMKL